ncbi:hypothetical protein ACJJTC_000315 [Scirpophaga incertulas]
MQSSLHESSRLLCVNCRICINRIQRHNVLELDTRVISVICEWITPVIITDEDYICDCCWQSALEAVNTGLMNDPGSSSSHSHGHTNVCILCGKSLRNNNRSQIIITENPSSLEQAIRTEIQNRVSPRQVYTTDCVCYPCWRRVDRYIMHLQEQAPPEPHLDPVIINAESEHDQEDDTEETTINLDYRRAANTASHCVFRGCQNSDLHRISDALRATVVKQYKYYMPSHVRSYVVTVTIRPPGGNACMHEDRMTRK